MKGIPPKTEKVLNQLSGFDCIKPYTMIGGTALSLQINHRLSEDIDFCRWKTGKSERHRVNCSLIEKELVQIGNFKKDIISDDQVDYVVNDVKVSFYCNNLNKQPSGMQTVQIKDNLKIADIHSIGVMKLEVMLRRSTFRDYYDIYSIVKAEGDLNVIIDRALKYSNHRLRTRDILSMLSDSTRFRSDISLVHLSPKYDITANDIEIFLRPYLKNYNTFKVKESN